MRWRGAPGNNGTMTKINNEKSAKPVKDVDSPARPVIRPLYGVFVDTIRTTEAKIRSELGQTVEILEQAIEDKDRDINGAKDRRLAQTAVKELKEAIEKLKGPAAPTANKKAKQAGEAAADTIGVIRPLYGVFINTQVRKVRDQVDDQIETISDTLKAPHKDKAAVKELEAALKDLKQALKAIDKVIAS